MEALQRERLQGFDWEYPADVPAKKEDIGDRYQIPGFGPAAVLFSFTARAIMEELGPEKGKVQLGRAIRKTTGGCPRLK